MGCRHRLPSPLFVAVTFALGTIGHACSSIERGAPPPALDVLPATKYIARAFQKYPLVALSEVHGNAESQALFTSVIRDPDFQHAASDIVVEFGNARYQDAVDRYLAGGHVPRDELSRAWRDTTQISGIFNLPMFSRSTVGQDIDAVALLSHSPLTYAPPPPLDARTPYGAELERRRRLVAATMPFRGGRIRFELDRTTLLPDAREPLEAILDELERDPSLELLVKAFSDAREREPDKLSTDRANAVAEWLVGKGIDARRLTPLGCGSVRPLTFGETEPERQQNRRAELVRRTSTAGCEPPW